MKSKNFLLTEETGDARFDEGLKAIQDFTDTLPVISAKDKKGNRLIKAVFSLMDKAIEVAPKLKDYLQGGFQLSNLVDNKAMYDNLAAKVAALKALIARLELAMSVIGIHMDSDYRKIYAAIDEAVEDDVSLKTTRDLLGSPYEKTAKSEATSTDATTKVAATG
jgi:hypothetical protein